MSLHLHNLDGCAPTPLAHYLKALAVLRLVSEQKDPGARGWWDGERFCLATVLDREELVLFFLKEYAPSPIVAPWNGGSGFYPKDNQTAIVAIAGCQAPRSTGYREAILFAGQLVKYFEQSPKGAEKDRILQKFRSGCSARQLQWLEAALTLSADGSPAYPALLGTGGNDGRLDFTNNFMLRLTELFQCDTNKAEPADATEPLLLNALFAQPTDQLQKNAIGQFLPGGTGGANSTTGFDGPSMVNSWDFLFTLEGAICFSAGLARRATSEDIPQAAAPFAVRSTPLGYASAGEADAGARGEQWFPLWSRPFTLSALRQMITEGRASIGRKTSTRGVDFARAVARFGIARGISGFQRFAYIERNGQANLATPLGRWKVEEQPHQNLIDQVAGWIDILQRAARGSNAPASIGRAGRTCEEAVLACCRRGNMAASWQNLLIALGMAEKALLASPKFSGDPKKRLRPLPPLDPAWLAAMDDGSAELRLAAGLAGQYGTKTGKPGSLDWHDPVRRHFLPLAIDRQGRIFSHPRFAEFSGVLQDNPDVVFTGRDLLSDCAALLGRRLHGERSGGLNLDGRYPLSLDDIGLFLSGRINEQRLSALAWPLTALRWHEKNLPRLSRRGDREKQPADGLVDLYGLLRLAHLSGGTLETAHGELVVRADPAILRRLLAGRPDRAVTIAVQRLQASGLRSCLGRAIAGRRESLRLAASLAFPLRKMEYEKLVQRLTIPQVYTAPQEPEPVE